MILQQATFTSARTSRSDGYHLISRSRGVDQAAARALSMWGPSHDSLLPSASSAVSYFRLPGGEFCVARTTREELEHSGRCKRIHTHMLLISPADFAKLEFHPILLHELARSVEQFRTAIPSSELADEVELPWPNTKIELELLERVTLADEMGLVPGLCEAVSSGGKIGLVHAARPLHLLAGLFFWMPQELRAEVSFTSGLKYSPRRDFRLLCLEDKPAELRQHARRGIAPLDIADEANFAPTPPDGWQAVMAVAAG